MARKKKDQVPGALTALLFAAGGYTYLNTSSPATAAVVFVGGLTLILLALFRDIFAESTEAQRFGNFAGGPDDRQSI